MLNRKVKIKFHKNKTNVPIIQFKLENGKSYFGAVDTGSESTVMSARMINDNLKLFEMADSNEIAFVGVSGGIPTTIKMASATFIFGEHKCLISGMMADLDKLNEGIHEFCGNDINISAVFGCNTFKQLDAIIDFKEESINLKL